MFEFQTDTEKRIVFIAAVGVIRPPDFQATMPELLGSVSGWDSFRVLLDWEALEGWDPAAESDAFNARLQFRHKLQRVAVIADQKWGDEIRRLSDTLDCEMRCFDLSERDQARVWIGAD